MLTLTHADVRLLFDYSPDTGRLTWRMGTWAGYQAGWLMTRRRAHAKPIMRVTIAGTNYTAGRIVWLWQTGKMPASVQYRDDDGTNLRWANLRTATPSQRAAGLHVRSTSGVKGVSWAARQRKWRARIKHKGVSRLLGYFDTIAEAEAVYNQAAAETFGEYFRPSKAA
jgi:hypothetical protein